MGAEPRLDPRPHALVPAAARKQKVSGGAGALGRGCRRTELVCEMKCASGWCLSFVVLRNVRCDILLRFCDCLPRVLLFLLIQ